MKKIIFSLILMGVFLFGNLSFLLAWGETTTVDDTGMSIIDSSTYNFFTNLNYKLQKIGIFTAAGQARECSTNADATIYITGGVTYSDSAWLSEAGCSPGYALYDVFDTDWRFLNEYKSEAITGYKKLTNGIVEVYCCPYKACTSNSGCSSPPASDYGTTCNTNYGSCYGSTPTHDTDVYKCVDGAWKTLSDADYGEPHFCSDPDDNNYIDYAGAEHCASSAKSIWCPALPTCKTEGQSCTLASDCCSGLDCQYFQCVKTGVCSVGQTKCGIIGDPNTLGDVYYTCVSGTWQSQGKVDGKCGYSEEGDIRVESGKTWTTTTSITNKKVTFKIPLKNYGNKEETINLEAGFYSSKYATDVAKLYSAVSLFSSIPIMSCNPYEEFVLTKQVTLAPGQTETIEIQVDAEKGFSTYSVGEHNLVSEPLIAFFGLYKKCLGGYINEAGTTGKGVMFDYKEYSKNCPFLLNINVFCGTEKIGTCKSDILTITKDCSIPLTTEIICGPGDTDCDGIIDRTELGILITKWINGEVSRDSLGTAIQMWAKS